MVRTLAVLAATLALAVPAARSVAAPGAGPRHERADVVEAAREYRAALDVVLGFRRRAVEHAEAVAAERRALETRGVVSRREREESDRALERARDALAETTQDIARADGVVAEADAARQLALLPAPPAGETRGTATLVRFRGAHPWALAEAGPIERFFARRFGRPLPVSAFGQTPLHDRLGFDHRNAMDVAVHPDSPEGQALIAYLREHGISYLAFRAARPGEATGAHVHVGEPSHRLDVHARAR